MIVSTAVVQRRALFVLALTLLLGASRFITETWAAGAFAVGKCGAYGQAYDFPAEAAARAAALRRPWLRGEAENIGLAQRRDAEMLRIRRQGMRDPRLGLRREGVKLG